MEKTNQIASQRETQNDIIELGVASVDTHGPGEVGEFTGIALLPGISDE